MERVHKEKEVMKKKKGKEKEKGKEKKKGSRSGGEVSAKSVITSKHR